jgi:hypothetical protein
MSKNYKIKSSNSFPEDPTGLDRIKRDKVEKILNKQLTDWEWVQYKLMTITKKK